MGFCIFANIAIAIRWARANLRLARFAIVDWDVHHGNGTHESLYDDPDTLAISIHQDNLCPSDSGRLSERGERDISPEMFPGDPDKAAKVIYGVVTLRPEPALSRARQRRAAANHRKTRSAPGGT